MESIIVEQFTLPTNAVNNYVLTCDEYGNGTWEPNDGGDSGIDAEVARAESAEALISTNLLTEQANRIAADNTLSAAQATQATEMSQINDILTGNETEILTNFINLYSGSDLTIGNHSDCTSIEVGNSDTNMHIYAASTTIDGALTVPTIDSSGSMSVGGGTCTELILGNATTTTMTHIQSAQTTIDGYLNANSISANALTGGVVTSNGVLTAPTSNITDLNTRFDGIDDEITAINTALAAIPGGGPDLNLTGDLVVGDTITMGGNFINAGCKQPITVGGTFTNNSVIPLQIINNAAVWCEIKLRFSVNVEGVNVTMYGLDGAENIIAPQQAGDVTRVYNSSSVTYNTSGDSYLTSNTGSGTMAQCTLNISKYNESGNTVNMCRIASLYTLSGVGSATLDGVCFLETNDLMTIAITSSAGTVSGTYSVTNYF